MTGPGSRGRRWVGIWVGVWTGAMITGGGTLGGRPEMLGPEILG
jgi:hypothetical protein